MLLHIVKHFRRLLTVLVCCGHRYFTDVEYVAISTDMWARIPINRDLLIVKVDVLIEILLLILDNN